MKHKTKAESDIGSFPSRNTMLMLPHIGTSIRCLYFERLIGLQNQWTSLPYKKCDYLKQQVRQFTKLDKFLSGRIDAVINVKGVTIY